MPSYEDGMRAVELCSKHGRRVRPRLRQLGWPKVSICMGFGLRLNSGFHFLRANGSSRPIADFLIRRYRT